MGVCQRCGSPWLSCELSCARVMGNPLKTLRGLQEPGLSFQNCSAGGEQHVAMLAPRSTENLDTGLTHSDPSAGWGRLLLPLLTAPLKRDRRTERSFHYGTSEHLRPRSPQMKASRELQEEKSGV